MFYLCTVFDMSYCDCLTCVLSVYSVLPVNSAILVYCVLSVYSVLPVYDVFSVYCISLVF